MQNLTSNNNETRHVSIVLKNNGTEYTDTNCTLCGDFDHRMPVDFVVEGTSDHVCYSCAAEHDDVLAESGRMARDDSHHYFTHREGNFAVWRAALILYKAKSTAVQDFHKYVDISRGMRLIPDDVRRDLSERGLKTLADIAHAWRWPENEEPCPF